MYICSTLYTFFFAKKAMRKIGKIGDKRGKIVLPLCCYIPILYIYNILKKKKNIFSYYVENLCKYVGNIHICKYLFMEMCIHIFIRFFCIIVRVYSTLLSCLTLACIISKRASFLWF